MRQIERRTRSEAREQTPPVSEQYGSTGKVEKTGEKRKLCSLQHKLCLTGIGLKLSQWSGH